MILSLSLYYIHRKILLVLICEEVVLVAVLIDPARSKESTGQTTLVDSLQSLPKEWLNGRDNVGRYNSIYHWVK